MLIGAGIDARIGYPTLFDGLDENSDVIPLQLNKVKSFESGAVMISYKTLDKLKLLTCYRINGSLWKNIFSIVYTTTIKIYLFQNLNLIFDFFYF